MKITETIFLLFLALVGSVGLHLALSGLVKGVLGFWSPLVRGTGESFTYQRSVYRTADAALRPVWGLVALAGLTWGVGLVGPSSAAPWLMLGGGVILSLAVVLDLRRWDRVAVSDSGVWFQRGVGHSVHRIIPQEILEVLVQEKDEAGATPLRWWGNRSARLTLRLVDHRCVFLPKTDARRHLPLLQQIAAFLQKRIAQPHSSRQSASEQKGHGAGRGSSSPSSRGRVANSPPAGVNFPVLHSVLDDVLAREQASIQRAIERLLKNAQGTHTVQDHEEAWAETQILAR